MPKCIEHVSPQRFPDTDAQRMPCRHNDTARPDSLNVPEWHDDGMRIGKPDDFGRDAPSIAAVDRTYVPKLGT
jgi:hypothetical protein